MSFLKVSGKVTNTTTPISTGILPLNTTQEIQRGIPKVGDFKFESDDLDIIIKKDVTEIKTSPHPSSLLSDDAIEQYAISLTALAEKAGLTPEKLMKSDPEYILQRLGKPYTTSKCEEEDKELMAKITTLQTVVDKVVEDFEDLYQSVLKVKDIMSVVHHLESSQMILLKTWKAKGFGEFTNEDNEFIVDFVIKQSPCEERDFLIDWANKNSVVITHKEINVITSWLSRQSNLPLLFSDPDILIEQKKRSFNYPLQFTDDEKTAFRKWKETEGVLRDEEITLILNWVTRLCLNYEDGVCLLAWMKKRESAPYTEYHDSLIDSMYKMRTNLKVSYVDFKAELNTLLANFDRYSEVCKNRRIDFFQLREVILKRINKDKSRDYTQESQSKTQQTLGARYNGNNTQAIINAFEEFNGRSYQFKELMEEIESKFSKMENETIWNFKYYFSLCCYCSAYKYDTNAYLVGFKGSYRANYHKYGELENLNFDSNGFVVPIDEESKIEYSELVSSDSDMTYFSQ